MHPNEALLTKFYGAFSKRDYAAMGACYHDDATFDDPAFPGLDAKGVRSMWHMLCERGKDLELTFSDIKADDTAGSAHWEADYTFSATGRKVHNVIDAAFEFKDGLIVRHVDTFSFWTWSRQALGAPGLLLGWTPFLKNKVQSQAGAGLRAFMAKK